MMGERCTVLFSEALSTLRITLFKLIGDGSDLLLREIGKDMGIRYSQLVLENFPELNDVGKKTLVHELCSIILRNTGFGSIEILDIDFEEPSMEAIIADAPSGLTVKSGPIFYHFEAGMLAGILREIFKTEMTVTSHTILENGRSNKVAIGKVE
ncbi:MAG: hypothetical protein GXO65_07640 [Euryarchaeota archaeon]|nr:hypothetical protein [Euryarchaeota archaeon]